MHYARDANGLTIEVSCIAESLRSANAADPLPPRPESWAAQAGADLANWTLKMAPGACWTLPAATGASTRRSLYFFMGYAMSIDGQGVGQHAAFELQAGQAVTLINGDQSAECLLLEGRPINEPVAQHRSVVNTRPELQQAHDQYRRTRFGRWPFADHAPVSGPERVCFWRHVDRRVETRP